LGKQTLCITQTPRYVMVQGFLVMGVLYMVIGINWNYLRGFPLLLVFLYGMTFFFANYGPNTTTFILPSLVYSHDCRSTLNGISAASGKLGALVGASFFEPMADELGDDRVMMICSAIAILACVLTYFLVPKTQSGVAGGDVQE
jgi:MFS transporter, PHS family, inorganic phosphate transporter